MSIRQYNLGSIVKPGFNPLATPAPIYTYNLYTWGRGVYGTLGLGNTTSYSSPKQVGSLTDWLTLAGSGYATYGIKTDGTLWSWGINSNGGLGLGNITPYSSPKQIGALTSWLKISTGYFQGSALAIKTDGTLWSWGRNDSGQLGLGNRTKYSSPKQVGSLTNWLSICNFGRTCLAIKTDGTLWSWGYNVDGQLGLGNTTYYSSPKQVGSLTTWLKLTGGGYGSNAAIAIKTDGTMWTWGYNGFGQLGLNDRTSRSSPTQVGSLTTWSKIAGNMEAMAAIKTDGTLWMWGYNFYGTLGLGNITYYSSPKQVGSLTTWKDVNVPFRFTIAIKTDGTLWGWGQNNYGQLGQSNTTDYSSPKQVGSLTNWNIAPVGGISNVAALKY